ncbi:16S rRNA (cytidine(1402)-2'-O)-methyltransferase [Profundibacterium mesophilum]|uniref:Ribosomal RNA small subunit methyltransferase I n=1 Tax=Profundibacterium mesophilum KAUST100406-0324 TaxID=1037889 RepID=A0A921NXI5_9RHOB|nr:16S rRNA (cytidine(1402)-2'-O)-methyltransferase [Profundibacterium mesophilum]KAF0675338.1 Ribosomal RNA small subunit methyltransferase I [Profundibacterium mesophilum KAUST100406-0324]
MSLPPTRPSALAAGLYFVATPIGSARDITLRALDILRDADVIAAEDTRTLRKLLEIHGVPLAGRQVLPYHDHNGPAMRPKLLALIAEGRSVAYASDAGTPLVADPGFALGRDAIAAGLPVTGAPGPSAVLAALTLAGLPSDRFLFAGFLPPAQGARKRALRELGAVPATLVLFEAPKRCAKTLNDIVDVLGEDRRMALCRELTKRFEEVRRGTAGEIAQGAATDPPRGEIVLVIDRGRRQASAEDMEAALSEALETMSMKDAAREVAEQLGLARRDVYQAALAMGRAR